MEGNDMGVFIDYLSWNQVQDCLRQNYLPVLPIGAECKEHGQHLPMNTDAVQIQWLMENLVQDLEILVWPTVNYGYYPAFTRYSGSISLSRKTFVAVIEEIVSGILGHGGKNVILVNSGISTIPGLVELSLNDTFIGRVHLCNIYQGHRFQEVQQRLSQQRNGGHADEVETSLMLAISPDGVNLQQARSEEATEFVKGQLQNEAPDAPNYSLSGAMGNPVLASQEKGHELLDAMYQDVKSFIEHVMCLKESAKQAR